MESRKIYEESYNYLNVLSQQNTVSQITIDYNKLDTVSQGELRDMITKICNKRKREIFNSILNGTHTI